MNKHYPLIGLVVCLFIFSNHSFSQDVILTTDLDEMNTKVTEILPDLIKYKKWENKEGPTYSIEKVKVFKITYANGTSEIITKPGSLTAPATAAASAPAATSTPSSGGSSRFSAEEFKSNNNFFIHQAYVVDLGTGQISKLEKADPELNTKTVAAPFYASSSTSWKMEGDYSSVRLSRGGNFMFVIKIAPGMDPSDHVKLKRFDLVQRGRRDKNEDRHMPNTKYSGSVYGGTSENIDKNDVKCTYEALADGVYKIIPEGLESEQEYAFYVMHKFYAFGIN